MAKSLSFSFDLNTLYRVDDQGKNKSFSLASHGVEISLDTNNNLKVADAKTTASGIGVVVTTIDAVWQLTFDDGAGAIYIIGIEDVIGQKTPKEFTFSLSGQVLNIRRDGDNLVAVFK